MQMLMLANMVAYAVMVFLDRFDEALVFLAMQVGFMWMTRPPRRR